ncbi:hypothetical protein Ae168Ps1_3951c [Pseudonocardia sp. Ae168_Ps1]|uniref:hypothetical protein n=1 Tax=unclassified Pseudonocardia TaxID=2619320 RepID=UPI00094AAFAB|nr:MULTISPECIES: hypothetical protein [unclassified Pseudonocardia]OLL75550.1 hypothetical protein Ae150APs1_3928c [Pseudonocardia sp. Ae150A_Ps1]OLL81545.1 hypothetical protein Ae168Ps1_3951c [Pseudonocardia sp. Ae168_Ps1]OLL84342.1 hypothetical protein Ae263Ps1_1397 [Pseudonocardia sp. Ae263_Ps1]OLL95640.1 hypothetical protein Ae356Ps1_5537c [Pseudonocardia sp. Ae356_Ps1]
MHYGEALGTRSVSFVGSFIDGPGDWLIVLRGAIDEAVLDRIDTHIADFLAGTRQVLTIDASSVARYDDRLPALLGRTQHRLGTRRRLLRVRQVTRVPDGDAVPDRSPAPAGGAVVTPLRRGHRRRRGVAAADG